MRRKREVRNNESEVQLITGWKDGEGRGNEEMSSNLREQLLQSPQVETSTGCVHRANHACLEEAKIKKNSEQDLYHTACSHLCSLRQKFSWRNLYYWQCATQGSIKFVS